MSATPLSDPPRSQADAAYTALRDMLIRLEIPPGAPLAEAALTTQLGVGRTPLREAVNRLTEERLVVKYARRGTFAAEINLADLPLLTELRVELEGLAAESAARRLTGVDRGSLLRVLRDVEHPGEPAAAMEVDVRIHRAIYAAAHNPFLEESAARYHNLSTRLWYVFVDQLSGLRSHVAEHQALVHAILDGDAEAAGMVARHHVRNFARAVRDLL